jgi:hypothetical protein
MAELNQARNYRVKSNSVQKMSDETKATAPKSNWNERSESDATTHRTDVAVPLEFASWT